jgi:hypothetical protein
MSTVTEPTVEVANQTTIPIGEWVVYTVNCGECGGEGGQEVRGHDGWVDCPYCTPVEDCSLCGEAFPAKDRQPDLMLVDGRPQPVCRECWALEPGDDA